MNRGTQSYKSNQSDSKQHSRMYFVVQKDNEKSSQQQQDRYAEINVSKQSSNSGLNTRIQFQAQDEPQLLSLNPPNVTVQRQVQQSINLSNTKDDLTDNETHGGATSFHLKSGAFNQTLNKRGFTSPGYNRTNTIQRAQDGKDGTFTPNSHNTKLNKPELTGQIQVQKSSNGQKKLKETVLSQHFSSSSKEGTKLQVVNKSRNKAYMIPGRDISNGDRVITLPDPENLHSSQTNKQITNSSSQIGSKNNKGQDILKSPDIARMTNTIANYLKECQQNEVGDHKKNQQEQSSALIHNTQMRAHLTTARKHQPDTPVDPTEIFSFRKKFKQTNRVDANQGRMFSKLSARNKGYHTIDDKARRDKKAFSFKSHNQRNRANLMSVNNADQGPFNNSALAQSMQQKGPVSSRLTTSMMNRTNKTSYGQQGVYSQRNNRREAAFSQLTDIVRESPMLIKPFHPKQVQHGTKVQFFEGKIPDKSGFFNRRNLRFSINNQNRPSTQARLVTNNHTSKQMSTIDNEVSRISNGGSESLTHHVRANQINLKKQRDSDQFVQDFMIEQNVIENAMQSVMSGNVQNIMVEAESPTLSREVNQKGQQSPMSNMTRSIERTQAIQNQVPSDAFQMMKVNEDRNSQTAPTGVQRGKKKTYQHIQDEDYAMNQFLQDGIEPISDLFEGRQITGQSGTLANNTFHMQQDQITHESGPLENPFAEKSPVINNDYIIHSDQQKIPAQNQGDHGKNRYGQVRSRKNSVHEDDEKDESQGDHVERGSELNTPLKMILKSTLNANQKPDPKLQAERAAAQLRKQKELARRKAEREKQFTKEDEQRIIGYIHRQYYRFCKRKEDFMNTNSIISNPTSQFSYNTDLANLQQLTNAAKYKSLYTFSFFKKYIIDKFLEQNSDFAIQVAKKALSALESLRTLKKQRSAHFTNIDHAVKTETLGSQDGLDPKAIEHFDIPLSELRSKYNKINAVSEACNRSQIASGSPSRDTALLPFVNQREQSYLTTKQDQVEPDITMDEHQEAMRQNNTGAAPSPKIKILHRPALFDQSIDMLNSDRGSRQSSTKHDMGFIEARIRSPTSDKGIRIPESLSSSFAEYETYIAYIQLQESQIETQKTKYKKTGVSISRQKRGGEPGIDLTSLADRKLFTSMKPQFRIQTLDFNKQIAKKGQAARAETLLQNCQRHEKKKIKNLYEKIKSLDPDSRVLKELTEREQKSPPKQSFRASRNTRPNPTVNTSTNQELRTSRAVTQMTQRGDVQDDPNQSPTDLEIQATAMSLASKNHAELQRLLEQGYFDKDNKNHVITLVTPGTNVNKYGDTSQRVQRLQNPPPVQGYYYDKNKLPSFGISMTNSGNTQISPRHPENMRPTKLSSIHISDMKIQFQNKSGKFDPGTVRLKLGKQNTTQYGSISSQRSQTKQVRPEDTRTTDSQVLRTGEQTRKISYNNIINDDYNNQDGLNSQNQAYQTLRDPRSISQNQGPIFEQNEQYERDNNSQSHLTNQSGGPIKTKRSVLMKSSVDSKVDRSNNVTNNAAQSYKNSEIPEKVQDDFLSKEHQKLGSGQDSLQYDPMFEYGLFDQINNTLANNQGISNVSSIRDIVPIQSVMSNPVNQVKKKGKLAQKNLIDGNTEPDQRSNQTASDKHVFSEGNKTLLKDNQQQAKLTTSGNNTVVLNERRKQVTQPRSQDSQENVVLDALGSCYGVMSPEIRRKSTQQRQNEKLLKSIRMKNKGNEDLNTIMPATKVKITRTGKPPTLSGSPQAYSNRKHQKYDSFQKQAIDKDKNSSLNESVNSQYDSDHSVQRRFSSQHRNSLTQREMQNNSPDGVKVANLKISDDRSKQEYMNEVNNSIVQLQKLMQQQDLSLEDHQEFNYGAKGMDKNMQMRKTERARTSNKIKVNGMFVSFDDQREHPNEFQKINQGFGDEAATLNNLKGCIQISKFTGSISPRKRSKANSKINSHRNSANNTCTPLLMRREQQQETQMKIQALQKMQRILIEHTEIENIMLKNQNNLTIRKNRY